MQLNRVNWGSQDQRCMGPPCDEGVIVRYWDCIVCHAFPVISAVGCVMAQSACSISQWPMDRANY